MAKRIKEILGHEMTHAWAHQTQERGYYCSRRTFYFEGRTIFSYGSHFPIATIDAKNPNRVWFTKRTYSPTTAGHISAARSAVSHMEVIYVWNVPQDADIPRDKEWIRNQAEALREDIQELIPKLMKARYPSVVINEITSRQNDLGRFIAATNLKPTKRLFGSLAPVMDEAFNLISKEDREMIAAQLLKEPVLREKAEERSLALQELNREKTERMMAEYREKEQLSKLPYAERVQIWKEEGKRVELHRYQDNEESGGYTLLRVKGEQIETSKGMLLPIPVAKRYYETVVRTLAEGGCTECNTEMMGFKVTKIVPDRLVVGCHDIPMTEIKDIAARLGW